MAAAVLTLRQISRATLARQMLLARARVTPLAAVERLVALQAQWPRPPFLGVWSRVEGFERASFLRLFHDRAIVRATFLRGTIHVVAAKDFVGLRPCVQPGLDAGAQAILKERQDTFDLDAVTREAKAFFGKQPRPFDALRDHFLAADPSADARAMAYAVRMHLPLVQVPEDGQAWAFPAQAAFAPAESWLKTKMPVKAAEPDPLVVRYLAAYGPASVADIAAWAGLGKPAIAASLDRLGDRVVRFGMAGRKVELFDLPDAPRPDASIEAPIRLIPEYDNLIGTRTDERFVAKAHRPRVFLSALRLAATVLVDGVVAATWKLTATKKAATIAIDPFESLPKRTRDAIAAEADALARFAEPDLKTRRVEFS